MSIPPIPPTNPHFHGPKGEDLAQKLYDLWTTWYQNPTASNGKNLLNFLKKNEGELIFQASSKPNPFAGRTDAPFEHYLNNAINWLQYWIDNGQPSNEISGISEWVGDAYDWLHQ